MIASDRLQDLDHNFHSRSRYTTGKDNIPMILCKLNAITCITIGTREKGVRRRFVCLPLPVHTTHALLLSLLSPRVVPAVVAGRVDVLERLQLGALEPHVRVRVVVVLQVTVVGRGGADRGRGRRRHHHHRRRGRPDAAGPGLLLVMRYRAAAAALATTDRLHRGSGRVLLDQPGPWQQAGRRRGRVSCVLQVIVHDYARLGIVAAEAGRRRTPAVDALAAAMLLLLLLVFPVIVRHSPDRRRPAAHASVHYCLAVLVVHRVTAAAARYVDVPTRDRELFVGHRRARGRLVVVVVVLLLLVLRGVHVHQRPVLPHGHAGQHLVAAAAALLKLPHGLCPLDLLALRTAHAAAVVVERLSARRRVPVTAERR